MDFTAYSGYSRHFRNLLLSQNFSNTKFDAEDDNIKKMEPTGRVKLNLIHSDSSLITWAIALI